MTARLFCPPFLMLSLLVSMSACDGLDLDSALVEDDASAARPDDAPPADNDEQEQGGPSDDTDSSAGDEDDGDDVDDNGLTPVDFDFDCIRIDRLAPPDVVPPAGLRLGFRVLDCNGDPIGPLDPTKFVVLNDEKGEPFGAGLEGGSVSDLAVPSNYGLFSVVALDLSDSIFKSGAIDQMVDGALAYLKAVERTPAPSVRHKVALMVFGRPQSHDVLVDFTSDFRRLRDELEALRKAKSLGSTDLYGAVTQAADLLAQAQGCGLDLTEKFLVLMTDGTHEAGDDAARRKQALAKLREHPEFHTYTIGIDGNYDPERLAELASTKENFVHVSDAAQLGRAFGEVAYRVDAMAKSNYSVGVCTPISLGEKASLTIEVRAEGDEDSQPHDTVTLDYPVDELNGDVGHCDARVLARMPPSGGGTNDEGCECGENEQGDRNILATVRDFRASHPDFEAFLGNDRGIVARELGSDQKPVYAGNPKTPTTTGAANFDQWYRDVDGVNVALPLELALDEVQPGVWEYRNLAFFPLDDQAMGNEGRVHNYHFTLETHLRFTYQGGETFSFSGDDDLWLFLNDQLVIDLGGVHSAQTAGVNLDEVAEEIGLQRGSTYMFDLFFAERHTSQSTFSFQTSLELSCE